MQGENKQKYIQVCQETPTKVCAYRLHRSHPEGKAVITVSPHDNNHTDQLFKCTYESRQAHNSIMTLSVSHASRQSHCQHNMFNSSELPCQQGSHRSSIMTPPAPNAVFTKILGHFRQLVPNVRWEISQIWIEYKPIRHMSDEPWKFSSTLQMTLQPKSYRGTSLTPCLMPFWANTISHCAGLLLSSLTVLCGPTIHEACSAGANGLAAQYWNTALGFPGHATWRLAFTPQQGSPRRSLEHVDDFIHNLDLLVVQTDAIHCICTQWNATLSFMESLSCINQHKLQ